MPKPKLKKMGNPNNQTVNAVRGVSAETLRAKRLAKKTPAGQQDEDRLVSYDPAHVRAAIEAQMCPFCGEGPFGVLAGHTVRAHGIDRVQLRSLGGYTVKESICSPKSSAVARNRTVSLHAEGKLWAGNPLTGGSALTNEGRRRRAETAELRRRRSRENYEANPDRCEICGTALPYEKQRAAHTRTVTCSEDCRRVRLAEKAREQWENGRTHLPLRTSSARPVRLCIGCGAPLRLDAHSRAKFCSKECADASRRGADGVCAVCGGPVERAPGRTPAKTCGRECLMKLFAERDAKRRHPRGECMICGGRIPADAPAAAKTCSDQCLRRGRSEWVSKARRRERGDCVVCGAQIPDTRNASAKTCSDECRHTVRTAEWKHRARGV